MRNYFLRLYTRSSNDYYIKLSKYLDNADKKFIVTANPEAFQLAKIDDELDAILSNEENDVLPDGIAIVKAAKRYGIKVEERITGIDTTIKLLELMNNKKKTLFLFGSKKEALDSLLEVIKRDYPCIKVLGAIDGYVEDKDEAFESILKTNPDVCLVAMGIPLQEKLIARHIDNAQKGIFIGVGGTFDVLSGMKKRAPKIFIKLNLEWLYRIAKEPSRLKRFYNNNIKFMLDVYREKK